MREKFACVWCVITIFSRVATRLRASPFPLSSTSTASWVCINSTDGQYMIRTSTLNRKLMNPDPVLSYYTAFSPGGRCATLLYLLILTTALWVDLWWLWIETLLAYWLSIWETRTILCRVICQPMWSAGRFSVSKPGVLFAFGTWPIKCIDVLARDSKKLALLPIHTIASIIADNRLT